jgi:predicted SAM-dependent methyltransferase
MSSQQIMTGADIETTYEPKTFFQKLKRLTAEFIGRERANKISAPYYDWLARRQTKQRLLTLSQSNLLVNLGCGYNALRGWINVDIARGSQVDIVWDLRKGLPFADKSCSAIFSEHVIEHLSKEDGENLLRECFRILQPEGVLRLSTPDAGKFLRSYAGDGEFLRHPEFSEPVETPLDRINQMMRESGQHLWIYDAASLQNLLKRLGFTLVAEQNFGQSLHPQMQNLDTAGRAFESLYIEAVKGL